MRGKKGETGDIGATTKGGKGVGKGHGDPPNSNNPCTTCQCGNWVYNTEMPCLCGHCGFLLSVEEQDKAEVKDSDLSIDIPKGKDANVKQVANHPTSVQTPFVPLQDSVAADDDTRSPQDYEQQAADQATKDNIETDDCDANTVTQLQPHQNAHFSFPKGSGMVSRHGVRSTDDHTSIHPNIEQGPFRFKHAAYDSLRLAT